MLAESRQAMYTALQSSRGHYGKQHSTAKWYPELRQARVDPPAKGLHFQTIGKADSNGDIWLHFEELLYLVERGSLVCHWFGDDGPPMSLQTLYSAIFGSATNLKDTRKNEIEMYQVYSYLKRVGFIVRRISSDSQVKPKAEIIHIKQKSITSTLRDTWEYLKDFYKSIPTFNELRTGNYHIKLCNYVEYYITRLCENVRFGDSIVRNYRNVYKTLDFIPTHTIPTNEHQLRLQQTLDQSINPVFNVWKPKENFKKSSPGVADWQVAIFNTLNSKVPTLKQTISLLESVPLSGYKCSASCLKRRDDYNQWMNNPHDIRCQTNLLKIGYRNIVIATVDSGIVNMSSVSDVPFGDTVVYY